MTALIVSLTDSAKTDASHFRAAAAELANGGNAESQASKDLAVPDCLRAALDAYRLGLRDLTLAAIELSGVSVGTSTGDLERTLTNLEAGRREMVSGAALAIVAVCDARPSTAQSPVAMVDLPSAYGALAARINKAVRDLDADTGLDSRKRAERLLAVEVDAAAAIQALPDPNGILDGLQASMTAAVSRLRDAAASTSSSDAESRMLTARLLIYEEGLVPDIQSQREAAAVTRQVLGLPILGEGDVL
jgi:hypothetical protein